MRAARGDRGRAHARAGAGSSTPRAWSACGCTSSTTCGAAGTRSRSSSRSAPRSRSTTTHAPDELQHAPPLRLARRPARSRRTSRGRTSSRCCARATGRCISRWAAASTSSIPRRSALRADDAQRGDRRVHAGVLRRARDRDGAPGAGPVRPLAAGPRRRAGRRRRHDRERADARRAQPADDPRRPRSSSSPPSAPPSRRSPPATRAAPRSCRCRRSSCRSIVELRALVPSACAVRPGLASRELDVRVAALPAVIAVGVDQDRPDDRVRRHARLAPLLLLVVPGLLDRQRRVAAGVDAEPRVARPDVDRRRPSGSCARPAGSGSCAACARRPRSAAGPRARTASAAP